MCPEVNSGSDAVGGSASGLTSALQFGPISRPPATAMTTSAAAVLSASSGGGLSGNSGGGNNATVAAATLGTSLSGGSLAVAAGSAVVGAATLPATSSPRRSRGCPPPRLDEAVEMPLIKVVVLGAPGVGKTALVKRFVSNEFPTEHVPSRKKSEFFPSLILNDALFELKLIDLPAIPFFPANTDVEWKEYRFCGLRSASAYLLVYDASTPSTFHYIKNLREQMAESRDLTNVPLIVAANKCDRLSSVPTAQAGSNAGQGSSSNSSSSSGGGGAKQRKDLAQIVRKGWRASHIECSAKFNWNVMAVFRELAVTLDMVASGQELGGAQPVVKKKRCLVF